MIAYIIRLRTKVLILVLEYVPLRGLKPFNQSGIHPGPTLEGV